MNARVIPLFPRDLAPTLAATLGDLTLDRRARAVRDGDGVEVLLTRTELDLLLFLVDHPGVALRRDALLDAVWGPDVVVTPRTVDNFVASLRRKLRWTPESPWRVQTLRGYGYRLDLDA